MRNVFMVCALMLGLGNFSVPSHAATSVSISIFHNDLAPYGRWVSVSPYGSVWTPVRVASGWRPYTNGYWTYTNYGWSWVSYEPFGNDVYHYGRWAYDPNLGWFWIPDTVWAPAWVAWQESDDYVGWAPLPPASRWEPSGLYYSAGSIQPASWVFVERPYFLNRHITTRIVPVTRNVTVLRSTRDVTHFDVVKGKPANRGIDIARVQSTGARNVARTYTAERQNVRTQKRVPATRSVHMAQRKETVVASRQERQRSAAVTTRPEQQRSTQRAMKPAQMKPAPNGKGKGKS